jgi:DNA replication protein DnaC
VALQNGAIEKLQEEYSSIRIENERIRDERLNKVYSEHPEIREADMRIMDLLTEKAFAALKGNDEAAIEAKIATAKAEKETLVKAAGVDPAYADRIYTCPYCKDTGFIVKSDGPAEKCKCFRKRESEILLEQSGMAELLKRNNFLAMRTDIFDDDIKDHFDKAVEYCRGFIDSFDTDYRNILFCGTVGTGKSFLSCCIASELLASYHSVVYMSANTLFDTLAKAQFSRDKASEAVDVKDRIYDCDLFIMDDLGSEMTNSFVGTELFTILNERYNSRKSTIISTNLELVDLRDRYSDRIFSRITGSYEILKLCGPDLRNVL